jgi:predicted TIM-barrel fold metal-dependent hydrolase
MGNGGGVVRIIDTDTHVSEPEDLWTSRVSTNRWGDLVPHARWDPELEERVWWWAGEPTQMGTGWAAMAGWKGYPPDHPPSLAEADPAAWNPVDRLARMDEYGIYAHVLYPNIGGFGSNRFIRLPDPELRLACVRAYNDFLAEWLDVDRHRFIPIMALPFWDLDASLRELERCAALGHKGILATGDPDRYGQPPLADPYWNRLWAAAQDHELTINFHVGNSDDIDLKGGWGGVGRQTTNAKTGVTFFLANARHILEVIATGICHRFPRLNFVSVESGVGWIPFVLEALDWQWANFNCVSEHPEMDLLPSEYFRRQVYGSFWFEKASLRAAIDVLGPDNLLYETDFPHPTSMSPGPATIAVRPADYVAEALAGQPADVVEKILYGNAARIYHLD